MNEAAIILKRDAGGRVVVAEQQRVDLVRAYERSGLSGPKFAALAGVNYQTFATWRRKHGTQPPSLRWPPDFGHRELEISYGGESWWEIRRCCFGRQ